VPFLQRANPWRVEHALSPSRAARPGSGRSALLRAHPGMVMPVGQGMQHLLPAPAARGRTGAPQGRHSIPLAGWQDGSLLLLRPAAQRPARTGPAHPGRRRTGRVPSSPIPCAGDAP
jgi:hypothetical protein